MRCFRSIVVVTAVLFLGAQCLPALWQMHCEDMGRTTLHCFEAKSCCMHEVAAAEGPTVEGVCCTFNKLQGELDAQQQSPATQLTVTSIWVRSAFSIYLVPHRPAEPFLWFAHKPPPRRSALDGLAHLGILRV